MKKYTSYEQMIADKVITGRIAEEQPPCVTVMKPVFKEYIPGESITYIYPVLDEFLNPRRTMQGGFIAAAFDNVLGTLAFLETKLKNLASADLAVYYHRPALAGEELTITAYLKHKGKNIVFLSGEAYNSDGKLVATATTNLVSFENNGS